MVNAGGEALVLSPERVVFWSRERILIASDLHLGKTAHFRKHGIAVSSAVMHNDLQRLARQIEIFDPRCVLVTGDLFHRERNTDVVFFEAWRAAYRHIDFTLISGNHDMSIAFDFEKNHFKRYDSYLDILPFRFEHHFRAPSSHFSVSGHLHPGIVLEGPARRRLRLPCFVLTGNALILPAFSEFTGLDTGKYFDDAKYYAIAGDKVLAV